MPPLGARAFGRDAANEGLTRGCASARGQRSRPQPRGPSARSRWRIPTQSASRFGGLVRPPRQGHSPLGETRLRQRRARPSKRGLICISPTDASGVDQADAIDSARPNMGMAVDNGVGINSSRVARTCSSGLRGATISSSLGGVAWQKSVWPTPEISIVRDSSKPQRVRGPLGLVASSTRSRPPPCRRSAVVDHGAQRVGSTGARRCRE